MTDIAYYDPRQRRMVVPAGAIIADELRACDWCGHDVNVLTVATAHGPEIMPDDDANIADEGNTVCGSCRRNVSGFLEED